jgi:dephospho-CoA kinase
VLDADHTARAVVATSSPALKDLVAEFGKEILQNDGSLDRPKLGQIVFADADRRARLNAILHPYIIAQQDVQLHQWELLHPDGIAVVDAALMIESGGYKRFDKLVVVHCRPEIQLARVMARSNLNRDEAEKRIAAQLSQDEKMKFADYLIDSSEGFEATRKRAEEVYDKLHRLALSR